MTQDEGDSDFHRDWSAARAGDEAARARLLESVRQRIGSFLERRMGPAARRLSEVEDLVQNALLDLHRRLERFPADLAEGEFAAYALQIARWRLADLVRRPGPVEGASKGPAEAKAPRERTGVVTREDERRFCREQLDRLPESDRLPLEAFHLRGLTVAEIAAELGLSREAVKQRLVRGRRRLRDHILQGRTES